MLPRDYLPLLDRVPRGVDAERAMHAVCDGVWDLFGLHLAADMASKRPAVSWVGFYLWSRRAPDELTLAVRRDKPACSPIGLHGACGRCFSARRPLVVTDVAHLGAGYIACDPRDRSEVVVPLINPDGSCAGVLDLDSHERDAFDALDAVSLVRLLRHAGLTAATSDRLDEVDVV